jgi:hypothetical protein
MSTPAITNRLAKLCHKEYHVKSSILALATALSNQFLYPLNAKTCEPLDRSFFNAASAGVFKGLDAHEFIDGSMDRNEFRFAQILDWIRANIKPNAHVK